MEREGDPIIIAILRNPQSQISHHLYCTVELVKLTFLFSGKVLYYSPWWVEDTVHNDMGINDPRQSGFVHVMFFFCFYANLSHRFGLPIQASFCVDHNPR
jgi:hypothetical protein